MNYIQQLQTERDAKSCQLAEIQRELLDLMIYLQTDKFAWPDQDYVHIRTDLMPKLQSLMGLTLSA
jgi:hypothetical protein